MREIDRPGNISIEKPKNKSIINRAIETVDFLRTALGGVPEKDMGKNPKLGRVPEQHPNI